MKSITTKLFLALLSLTTLVLLATLLLARWSFDYGFLDYLNSQQQRRLNNMASDLSEHYKANDGHWSEASSQAYRQIYRKWFPGPGRGNRPPHGRRPSVESRGGVPQPELNGSADNVRSEHSKFSLDRSQNKRPRPKERIAVYDRAGNFLVGNKDGITGEVLTASILYGDVVVGEIRSQKKLKLDIGVESSFSKQQSKASLIIAILSLLIAGIASWCLARMLLAPTYKMTHAIAGMVKGDYKKRLDVERDDELGQLMRDINRLSDTLNKNQLSRKRWLADISHELRTPVAILSGELEAVLDGIRPLNSNTIESLNHETARLKHLIDDLYQLSLSDIGGLRYEFNLVDVGQLIEYIVGQHESRIKGAGIKLTTYLDDGVIIDADESRLEQLFINLINNSVAYTDAPGQLNIYLEQSNDVAVIRFEDSAPSVMTQQLEDIFEPLFREDGSRNRRKAGAGLGLTISQNIVQAHQGSIDVKKSVLDGLEFTITLPTKHT